MQVHVLEVKESHYPNIGRSISAVMQCGKVKMSVSVNRGYVWAVVHNASNRAWKGYGKAYRSLEEAYKNYRSPQAQAMLNAVNDMWSEPEVAA